MGKKKTSKENEEPLFTPLKTTDDDDDDDIENAGPPTRYQDNPNTSPNHKDDDMNGPPISYRDEPGSIFDWDDGTPIPTTSSSSSKKKKSGKNKKVKDLLDDQEAEDEEEEEAGDGIYQIDDTFNPDGGGFSPVSLHDDDSDDDDDDNDENVRLTAGGGASDEEQGAAHVRRKANKLLNQRVFDETTYDDTDDRIFVGGGWGRHGSQFSLCPRGCCATLCCCCCRTRDASSYSRGPKSSKLKSGGLCKMVCVGMAFVVLVFGSGYLGYEAGLPVEEVDGTSSTGGDGGKNSTSSGGSGMAAQQHHAHTKGEQWVEWLEHEKEEVHMPHFNFTFKRPHRPHGHSKDGDKQQRPQIFQPKTQVELLHMSENIFQSCSERSLRTKAGRDACNSLCHGHYCCFEKDAVFGSCVATPNSYCFAYAACENIVIDFGMDNVNTLIKDTKKEPAVGQQQGHDVHGDNGGQLLNANDLQLLKDTCSVENIATLDGIRDCTTFCEHHLCCFNSLESENCSKEYKGECLAYDACKILFFGPEAEGVDVQSGSQTASSSSAGGGGNSGGNYQVGPPSAQTTTANGNNNAAAVAVKASFKDECMSNNIKENWETCRSHCEEFECCFSQNDSCYKDQSLVCDEYYICEEFYFEQEEEEYKGPPDAVETVYQSPSLSNNQGSGGSSNLSAQKDAVHAVCSLVESNSESDPMVTACHALCANYLCCFSQSGTQSNCRATYGEDTCNAFMECSVLTGVFDDFNPNSGSVAGGPPAPGASNQADVLAVKQSCVAKARRDPWVAEQCRKACDVRWCCYQSEGPGNCNAINQEWCDEFEACDVIYGGYL